MSFSAVKPEILEVRFGYDVASASVIFNPNYRALADAMYEAMDQLGEVEGSDSAANND